jgi:aromatic ring-opening dioxygenase catalytic subunit (LigB family)
MEGMIVHNWEQVYNEDTMCWEWWPREYTTVIEPDIEAERAEWERIVEETKDLPDIPF